MHITSYILSQCSTSFRMVTHAKMIGLVLLYLVAFAISRKANQLSKVYHLDYIDACRDGAKYPMYSNGYEFRTVGDVLETNSTVVVTEDLDGPLRHNILVERCEMDLSSCEDFNEVVQEDLCSSMFDDPSFMQEFVSRLDDKIKCPIKTGSYRFVNRRRNISSFLMLPSEGYRWHSTTTIVQVKKQRTVYCLEAWSRVVKFRSRKTMNISSIIIKASIPSNDHMKV